MENFGKLKRRCAPVIWSLETVHRSSGYVKTAFLYSVTVTYRFRLHGPIESRGLVIRDAWCNCTATVCPRANTPGYTKATLPHNAHITTGLSHTLHPQARGHTEMQVFMCIHSAQPNNLIISSATWRIIKKYLCWFLPQHMHSSPEGNLNCHVNKYPYH